MIDGVTLILTIAWVSFWQLLRNIEMDRRIGKLEQKLNPVEPKVVVQIAPGVYRYRDEAK